MRPLIAGLSYEVIRFFAKNMRRPWVRVVSRRGAITLPCQVVRTIRPDTVFVPYHWPEERSANLLTIRALDPISKIPAFKVCAVRLEKVAA